MAHLQVAAEAAREAAKIEQANVNAEFGPWFDGMMRLVPVSVVMAGAALEANANEVLQDILDSQSLPLTRSRKKLLMELKEERSGNALDKCRRLALLMDKEADTGTETWYNAKLLQAFRNEFMHFRPSWDDDSIHSGKLVAQLKQNIPVVNSWRGAFLFPYGFMTYGCANWAVQTVLNFSSDFSKVLGAPNNLEAFNSDYGC